MARQKQQKVTALLCVFLGIILSVTFVHAEAEKGANKMTIAEGSKVSVEYTLTLENKEVVDSNKGSQPLTFVVGSKQIIPGLEKEMIGMKVGDSKDVTVQPEDGYGPVVSEAIIEVGKDQLPPDAQKVGAQVQGQGSGGQKLRGQVKELKDDKAIVDFNHPLAGQTLFFAVKVLEIGQEQAAQ